MMRFDVLVVGGGPAGSTCARYLSKGGADVLVLDREAFPRQKLCAGWVTPEAMGDFELAPKDYPHRLNTFDHLEVSVKRFQFKLKTVQHSIRRYELDEFLLKRSGASVHTHNVRKIEQQNSQYVIDGRFQARYLVGAGGTRCPVYRQYFRDVHSRSKDLQVATLECEFPYEWTDPNCHLWFFEHGLPGYSWYVPKANGYLNIGIGGMAQKMKDSGKDLKELWTDFLKTLRYSDLLDIHQEVAPKGYSYYLRSVAPTVQKGNVFLAGDAVGLATSDLGEGIGPAARSGRLVAEAILNQRPYSVLGIEAYSPVKKWISGPLNYLFWFKEKSQLNAQS